MSLDSRRRVFRRFKTLHRRIEILPFGVNSYNNKGQLQKEIIIVLNLSGKFPKPQKTKVCAIQSVELSKGVSE